MTVPTIRQQTLRPLSAASDEGEQFSAIGMLRREIGLPLARRSGNDRRRPRTRWRSFSECVLDSQSAHDTPGMFDTTAAQLPGFEIKNGLFSRPLAVFSKNA
jgi:hypothetical protein